MYDFKVCIGSTYMYILQHLLYLRERHLMTKVLGWVANRAPT